MIWNGIVPQLQQIGLLAKGGQREDEPRLTLVFGRNGWSPRLFRDLRVFAIAVVTWIKGPQQQRWVESAFRKAAIPVRASLGPATLEGRLAERKLVGKPARHKRRSALVTTHPSLAVEQAAGLVRSCWTQQNYFKYQRAEFGLDTLPEHALVDVDDEAWVDKPA